MIMLKVQLVDENGNDLDEQTELAVASDFFRLDHYHEVSFQTEDGFDFMMEKLKIVTVQS